MKNKREFLIGTVLLAIFAVSISFTIKMPRVLASTNQTLITVNVSEITRIAVWPTSLTWNGVGPGLTGGMKYLDILNTGSTNITKVFAYVDTLTSEPNNPIPLGMPESFSSGSVLVIKKNVTDAEYYYAGRLEWNITPVIPGVTPPAGASDGDDTAVVWGYYRNATHPLGNYLFYLVNGTEINASGGCNSTGSKIMIEEDVDNGTTASREPNLGGEITATTPDWGIYNFTSGPLRGHCVALHRTCEKIYIYRYDRRNSGNTQFEKCGLTDAEQSIYVNTTKPFTPGEHFSIDLDVWVPQGVPFGTFASSWLTIEAEGALY